MAVEKLYESDNFLVVNKPYDMYINSDDEYEKVSTYNQCNKYKTSINFRLYFLCKQNSVGII